VKETYRPSASLSMDSALRGTPLYMSPEAIHGTADIDGRADIYALGCVAYFLLTGAPVFSNGNLIEILASHLHDPPPPLSRPGRPVPADLEALVLSCLEKDRSRRPASAMALRDALATLDCEHDWRESEARDWWGAHADRVRAQRGAHGDLASGATLAVDLGQRSTVMAGAGLPA
jgi:eukaryotic-like serine/threonine-protein kinase